MDALPPASARLARAAAHQPAMVRHRRHLHAHPEVGLELPATHAYVADALRALGLDPEVHPAGGVSVRIPGRSGDLVRVLRADMDALPLAERTGLPYASAVDGAMHACGHDLHTAMLLAAAAWFVGTPPAHDVVLAFQPGEEADRGALPLLEHRNLRDLPAGTTAFALHVNAVLPAGVVTTRPGTFMAFGDWFRVAFEGPGGHASAPHLAGNPIVAFAAWTDGARAIVEELRAGEHLVATVTEALAGTTVNVIPTRGTLRGTLRTLGPEVRDRLHARLGALTDAVAARTGLRGTLEITAGYPAVRNDAGFVATLGAALAAEGGHLTPMPEPSMVIEDFAYFLDRWPGAMAYLGAQVAGATSFNHSEDVLFDEAVMPVGLALHALVADLPASGAAAPRG